jgi:alpha-glucosidase
VSRIGKEQARIAVLLLLTLRGTPTLYYGDEIEMRDVPISDEDIKDPQGLNMPGKNLSRDPARTPMQWDDSEYGGFTTNKPWLPLAKDYKRKNVEQEKKFPHSMLALYKEVLSLREAEP